MFFLRIDLELAFRILCRLVVTLAHLPFFQNRPAMRLIPKVFLVGLEDCPSEYNTMKAGLEMIASRGHLEYQDPMFGHTRQILRLVRAPAKEDTAAHLVVMIENITSRPAKQAIIDLMGTQSLLYIAVIPNGHWENAEIMFTESWNNATTFLMGTMEQKNGLQIEKAEELDRLYQPPTGQMGSWEFVHNPARMILPTQETVNMPSPKKTIWTTLQGKKTAIGAISNPSNSNLNGPSTSEQTHQISNVQEQQGEVQNSSSVTIPEINLPTTTCCFSPAKRMRISALYKELADIWASPN